MIFPVSTSPRLDWRYHLVHKNTVTVPFTGIYINAKRVFLGGGFSVFHIIATNTFSTSRKKRYIFLHLFPYSHQVVDPNNWCLSDLLGGEETTAEFWRGLFSGGGNLLRFGRLFFKRAITKHRGLRRQKTVYCYLHRTADPYVQDPMDWTATAPASVSVPARDSAAPRRRPRVLR